MDACYGQAEGVVATLKRCGRARSSFTRMHSPMSVAMLQCCTVGVNCTLHRSSAGRSG